MTAKARNALTLIIILIVLLGGYFLFFQNKETANVANDLDINKNPGLKVCPEEMVVNEMPGPDRSGENADADTNDIPTRSSYYVLKGERREVDEFNTAWVAENCYVPVTSAH